MSVCACMCVLGSQEDKKIPVQGDMGPSYKSPLASLENSNSENNAIKLHFRIWCHCHNAGAAIAVAMLDLYAQWAAAEPGSPDTLVSRSSKLCRVDDPRS